MVFRCQCHRATELWFYCATRLSGLRIKALDNKLYHNLQIYENGFCWPVCMLELVDSPQYLLDQ